MTGIYMYSIYMILSMSENDKIDNCIFIVSSKEEIKFWQI